MRKLRLSLIAVAVSTWLAILTGSRPRGVAFADEGSNTVSQTNTEQVMDTSNSEEAATPTNVLPKEILDALHAQPTQTTAAAEQEVEAGDSE